MAIPIPTMSVTTALTTVEASSLAPPSIVVVNMAETSPGWAAQPSGGGGSARKQRSVRNSSSAPPTPTGDETTDRTAVVSAQLKRIYKKAVLPVEKRYKYDYFYDSPLLTDVEFDGRYNILCGTQAELPRYLFLLFCSCLMVHCLFLQPNHRFSW